MMDQISINLAAQEFLSSFHTSSITTTNSVPPLLKQDNAATPVVVNPASQSLEYGSLKVSDPRTSDQVMPWVLQIDQDLVENKLNF